MASFLLKELNGGEATKELKGEGRGGEEDFANWQAVRHGSFQGIVVLERSEGKAKGGGDFPTKHALQSCLLAGLLSAGDKAIMAGEPPNTEPNW